MVWPRRGKRECSYNNNFMPFIALSINQKSLHYSSLHIQHTIYYQPWISEYSLLLPWCSKASPSRVLIGAMPPPPAPLEWLIQPLILQLPPQNPILHERCLWDLRSHCFSDRRLTRLSSRSISSFWVRQAWPVWCQMAWHLDLLQWEMHRGMVLASRCHRHWTCSTSR